MEFFFLITLLSIAKHVLILNCWNHGNFIIVFSPYGIKEEEGEGVYIKKALYKKNGFEK